MEAFIVVNSGAVHGGKLVLSCRAIRSVHRAFGMLTLITFHGGDGFSVVESVDEVLEAIKRSASVVSCPGGSHGSDGDGLHGGDRGGGADGVRGAAPGGEQGSGRGSDAGAGATRRNAANVAIGGGVSAGVGAEVRPDIAPLRVQDGVVGSLC